MPLVLPGDTIRVHSRGGDDDDGPPSAYIKLGPGLLPSQSSPETELTATRPGASGYLCFSSLAAPNKAPKDSHAYWIETNTARYVPAPNDSVIGQITARGAESYTVSLSSSHAAILPVLSFQGATKRHKPNLAIGTLVYARLVSADRFTEPEITCIDPQTGKADGYGELTATNARGEAQGVANCVKVTTALARSLTMPRHSLLKTIAKCITFEAAVGINGYVWIRAANVMHLVAIGKMLSLADQQMSPYHASPRQPHLQATHHHHQEMQAAVANDQDDDQDAEELHANDFVKRRGVLDFKTIKAIMNQVVY